LFLASATATEIIAHRGFSARAPENTVAAFKLAWEQGADACELDLYLTKDQKIAVLHDKDTKRTAGVAHLVAETTLEVLQALDVGKWKDTSFRGERIPTLAESLATLPEAPGKRFFLEIKCGPEVVPVLAQELEPWKPRASQLCIIAFDREVARESKKAMPWLKVYQLSSEKGKDKQPVDLQQLIRDTKEDGLDGLDLSLKWPWTEQMVKAVRDAGLELYVWTVNAPGDVRRLADLGVDGITTDDPVMARKSLER
jgi:glycerophosphoryl diester phosphodiesterase